MKKRSFIILLGVLTLALALAAGNALAEPATDVPTEVPAETPTDVPTEIPEETPTDVPTEVPAETPTDVPTEVPAETPTDVPTEVPAETPTDVPTEVPAETPTDVPTEVPTEVPADGHAHWAWCNAPGVCAECGQAVENITDVRHDRQWKNDLDYQHIMVCTRCGLQDFDTSGEHHAKCDNPTKCTICGYEGSGIDKGNVGHYWQENFDADYHWDVCEKCGRTTGKLKHYSHCDSSNPQVCAECGQTSGNIEIRHDYDYDDTLQYDAEYHWNIAICLRCGTIKETSNKLPHERQCNGNTCLDCGAPYTGDQVRHSYSWEWYDWESNAEGHWTSCTLCGEKTEVSRHDFQYGVCTTCGYEQQESDPTPTPAPAPTDPASHTTHWAYCDDKTHCAVCGKDNTEVTIISVRHKQLTTQYTADECWDACSICGWENAKTAHRAACNGRSTCVFCGQSQGIIIHEIVHPQGRDERHTDETYHWWVCGVCGEEHDREQHYRYCNNYRDECYECGAAYYGTPIHDVAEDYYEWFADFHWQSCYRCSDQVNLEKHRSSCTAPDVCLVCGAEYAGIENVTHASGAEYFSDGESHWHVCADCGEKVEAAPHAFGPDGACTVCGYRNTATDAPTDAPTDVPTEAPTETPTDVPTAAPTDAPTEAPDDGHAHWAWCDAPNVCAQCGRTVENITDVRHEEKWFPLDPGHGKVCVRCGVVTYADFEGANDGHNVRCDDLWHCYLCGYTLSKASDPRDAEHYMTEKWDANYHWEECEKCGYSTRKEKHYAYCDGDVLVCAECGQTGNIDAIYHDYDDFNWEWQYDENAHWLTGTRHCNRCGVTDTAKQNQGEHKRMCSENTCETCGAPYTGDNVRHPYSGRYAGNAAGHWRICRDCGVRISDEIFPHVFRDDGTCVDCNYDKNADPSPTPPSDLEHTHWAYCDDPTHCAICGQDDKTVKIVSVQHDYIIKHDSDFCWENCTRCGNVGHRQRHAARCNNTSICSYCHASQNITISEIVHAEAEYIQIDSEYHAYACPRCGYEWRREKHSKPCYHDGYKYDQDGMCYWCGAPYTGEIQHALENRYYWEGNYHWRMCYWCYNQFELEEHKSSCAAPDICLVCGAEYAGIENIEHVPGKAYFSDATNHWHICETCGEKADVAAHDFNASGKCEVCGYQSTGVTPTNPPTDAPTDVPTNPPTGTPTDKPTDAPTNPPTGKPTDAPVVTPTPAPHEHTWVESSNPVQPSCNHPGTRFYRCSQCGETKQEEIQALGHDFSFPISSKDGTHRLYCRRCGNWKSVPCDMEAETMLGIPCEICGICGYMTVPAVAGMALPEAPVADVTAVTTTGEAAAILVFDVTASLPEGSPFALCLRIVPEDGAVLPGSVRVTIPCTVDTDGLRLIFILDGGLPEEALFEVIDGMLTFTADAPGIFALVPVQN